MNTEEEPEKSWLKYTLVLTVIFAGVAILAYGAWFIASGKPFSENAEEWGQFGDYLGGVVGTVLSTATVALLVLSVIVQLKAYRTMKEELKTTSDALAEQLQQSRERSALDNFQSTLELMLSQNNGRASLKDFGATTTPKLSRGDATSWDGERSIVETQFGRGSSFLLPLLKLLRRLGEIAIDEAGSKRRSLIATLSACLDDAEIMGIRILAYYDVPDTRLSTLVADPAFQMSKDNEDIFVRATSKFSKPEA